MRDLLDDEGNRKSFIKLFPQNDVKFFLGVLGVTKNVATVEAILANLRDRLQEIQDREATFNSETNTVELPALELSLLEENAQLQEALGEDKARLLLLYLRAEDRWLSSKTMSLQHTDNDNVVIRSQKPGFNAVRIYEGKWDEMPSRLKGFFSDK
ncbi:MAG: hypothetical protein KDN22_18995 [Verrucomicrobiae bacterium]|nr:hypothetical protein [Verrucomicrobiae bacterium]